MSQSDTSPQCATYYESIKYRKFLYLFIWHEIELLITGNWSSVESYIGLSEEETHYSEPVWSICKSMAQF